MGELTEFDYLKGSLFQFEYQKEELTKIIKIYCQNKENPLNKRWELFIDSNFGEHKSWIIDFNSVDLDIFYFEKYQIIYSESLVEFYYDYLLSKLYDELKLTCEYYSDEHCELLNNKIEPLINILKEEILELFLKSFEYNW